jgi:uncharacterized protein (TIGR03032 family)
MSDDKSAGDVAAALPPLRSVHTSNFPGILDSLGISLIVSTYQAGKLVVLRSDEGCINTLFRNFHRPMGVAVAGDRVAVGTGLEIWEFHNLPAVARRLPPEGRHDACYLPRACHVTGDVQMHEMAWGSPAVASELWFVNTRFSCLCTLDHIHSFVPRWRPPFITSFAPEDRCHLNGLCMVQGQPAFVTALGETDAPGGWRANKKDGGIAIEVSTGKILLRGLSMPHSPRWYDGRLWLLESGTGSLGYIDPQRLTYVRVAEVPGFTRGLDFCGRLAFLGLSQVRETAVFGGIPITERPTERNSGVWVVDIDTGQTVAFLKFEEAVREIFAVQVLPGLHYPELINDNPALIANSFVLPDEALAQVAAAIRFPSGQPTKPEA